MMNTVKLQRPEDLSSTTDVICQRLDTALVQIEQRFLDGGTVLVAVLDLFGGLMTSIAAISDVLKEEEAAQARGELLRTGTLIAALPAQQRNLKTRFDAIGSRGRILGEEVVAMEETLRYLRTFAVTAKITGAGIADFAGFAEEIVERIQIASEEVKGFGQRIRALEDLIGQASADLVNLNGQDSSIGSIVEDLGRDAQAIEMQRRTLADLASQVADLGMRVQNRLANTLSALQIGDVTRQRLEHCQAAYRIVSDHLHRPQAKALTDKDRDRVLLLVSRLVRDQLVATSADFDNECEKIIRNMGDFSNDVSDLLNLQYSMLPPSDVAAQETAMVMVRKSLEAARSVVAGIDRTAGEARSLSEATGGVVRQLVSSVETIQMVRADIQYMALNTNLRCSRLGEESRAISVVTNELRTYSAQLDDVTERALAHLKALDEQAAGLGMPGMEQAGDDELDLVSRIDIALSHVTEAAVTLEQKLEDLRQRGQDIALQVARATSGLNFHQDLTVILRDCLALASSECQIEDIPSLDGLETVLVSIAEDIFASYTMKSERDIHQAVFASLPAVEATDAGPREPQFSSDDALFDDALF